MMTFKLNLKRVKKLGHARIKATAATDNDNYPILREEVKVAVKSLKKGKSAGADNVPAELVQAGGEATITVLLTICNKI